MNDIVIKPSKPACFIIAFIIDCTIVWLAYGKVSELTLIGIGIGMMILPIIYLATNSVTIKNGMATVQTPASTFTMNSVEAMEILGWSLVITGTGGKKHTMHCVENINEVRNFIEENFGR